MVCGDGAIIIFLYCAIFVGLQKNIVKNPLLCKICALERNMYMFDGRV